jgi:hypothetical protein
MQPNSIGERLHDLWLNRHFMLQSLSTSVLESQQLIHLLKQQSDDIGDDDMML